MLTRRSNRFDLVWPITSIPYLDSQLNISSVPLTKKCEIEGVHILASKPLQFDFQTSNGDILDMWLTSTPALRDSAPLHTYVGTKSHSFLHSVESGKGVARRHIISLHRSSKSAFTDRRWSPGSSNGGSSNIIVSVIFKCHFMPYFICVLFQPHWRFKSS